MYDQIARNKRKTVFLVLGALVLLAAVGYALGLLFQAGVAGLVIALVIAVFMSWGSYMYGDQIVLRSTRAREVSPQEEPRLHNIVDGLCIAAGIPKPRVYIVPERAPNAFATGRNPEHSSLAVTQGLLDMMNRVELEGVVAHELSHVRDRDILVGTVVATLVGTVVLVAEFLLRWFWWGGGHLADDDDGGGGKAALILFGVGLFLLVLAPIFAQLIKFSVSRRREYLADAEGAMLTRYPPGLAAALRKIAVSDHSMRSANNATAHLWLEQPSRLPGNKTSWLERVFSTHPPIEDRIRILEDM
ncbi:MAG: M48 family metallopeptidase [Actinomycetota bacterium]